MRGIDTVAEALGAEDFPMNKQDVAYSVGDIEVEDSRGRSVPVRIVLDAIDQEEFATAEGVIHAIRAALDRAGHRGH